MDEFILGQGELKERAFGQIGPILFARWLNIEVDKKTSFVSGFLLVDTGASHTCMTLNVAHELHLEKVGTVSVRGSGGLRHDEPVFEAKLVISELCDFQQKPFVFEKSGRFHSITELERNIVGATDPLTDDHPNIIGLLGRDILKHCILHVDNLQDGKVRYSIKFLTSEFPQQLLPG